VDKQKPVGIWIRVSTEDQARGESPEHHEKRARYYAESKEWHIREVYHLEAVSGKSVMDHPETQRMLKHIKSGHITGLIFSKLARLARNTKELLEFADIFRERNADLISLQESIDTSTPAGRLFYTMIAAMAQWEREEIADRVAASVPIRAKLGKPLGGQTSFGYMWQDAELVPHPDEAPVRKLIYELFLEHKRKKTVARLLNQKGYRTRKGAKFTDTTVDRLLRDPTAKGLYRANYTRSLGDNKKWVFKPEKDWVLREVKAIVPEDLWNRCNNILDEQLNKRKKPSRKTVHLFSGIAYCHCGQKMYVPSNSPKYTCAKCRNKISVPDLEAIYQEQLKNFFDSDNQIKDYLKQADQVIKDKSDLLELLTEEKRKVIQEIEKTWQLYNQDKLNPDQFGDRFQPLDTRKKQLENQIPELQGEIDFLKIKYLSSNEIFTEAKDLYSRWPQLSSEEKRMIAENITENIIIGKDTLEVNLCYLPSSIKNVVSGQRNLRGSWPPPA
jgi:site-specific DNA recombinase